jgi:glycosyltransferase involved in cell wall biosynthesis
MASGISDYSYELLPVIGERATVDVYCPRGGPFRRVRVPRGVRLANPATFGWRGGEYDAVFQHLGNNPFHEFVYETALAHPGVAVFHDFVMHHLIAHITVEAVRRRTRYQELLEHEYGADAGRRLSDLRFNGVASEFEKFLFPLNEHVARAAQAIVVHSEDSAERMRAIVPGTPVWVIPHHAGSPPPSVAGVTRDAARARLGLPGDAFLVGHFGFVTRPKQPGAVIGGFERVARARPDARLIVTGADHTGGGLDRVIRRHGLEGRVVKPGYVDLERFYLYLKAVDAVIGLRYPSAGESSGTFCRALAEGRATIVNDLGSFAEVPSGVALKVEIDGDQAEQVGAHLIHLAEDPAFKAEVEARAHRYAATVLDPVRCANLYLQVASSLAAPTPAGSASWSPGGTAPM